ncbi:MAG: helix-turn-helix domain-containing protein [Bacteroidales bacterium]|nr:helix-turn-helix domain-containing protein [Bacteroidales bacterium]
MANLQIIKNLAELKKISIRDLAERVGIKENQIHVMCRTNSTKIDTLEKIGQVLGVHVSEFFDNKPSYSRTIKGNNNQLNEQGAYGNINGGSDSVLQERIKSLQDLLKEKDKRILALEKQLETANERIAEKNEQIADLKERINDFKKK